MTGLSALGHRLMLRLNPETAHRLALGALGLGLAGVTPPAPDKRLAVKLAGLALPNPVGIAAGFDKNAQAANSLLKLGFGFAEIGTVTPLPQPGNPRPRLFRLAEDEAIINRLGFNNEGHEAVARRLGARARRAGIVGVNIGANKDSEDRVADYVAGVKAFSGIADYFTVNVSSPNTPGLRQLQDRKALDGLLQAVIAARDTAASISGKRVPLFLKIAPDLAETDLDDIAKVSLARSLEGLIVSNTTLARSGLAPSAHAAEPGGLSGRPLFERATTVLAKMRQRVGPEMAIIGVGGVDSAASALEKIRAGADAVQLYTGFIYCGPTLARDIVEGLSATLDADGAASLSDYRDSAVEDWAARSLTPD